MLFSFGLAAYSGCATQHVPIDGKEMLLPLPRPNRWLPMESDRAAAKAAAAALANDSKTLDQAIETARNNHDVHKGEDLDALLKNLKHSTFDDARSYRDASRQITRGFGTDPGLEARLKLNIKDDPLVLARRRNLDTWETYFARTFNAVSQPLGQALLTGFVMAPLQLSMSAGHYLASFSNDEPLSTTDRQALGLRKQYLAKYPAAPDSENVRDKIDNDQKKLVKTMHRRRLRAARSARDNRSHRAALLEAKRALFWGPNDEAAKIYDASHAQIKQRHERIRGSLVASQNATSELTSDRYDLLEELLRTSSRSESLSLMQTRQLRKEMDRDTPEGDEATYIFAMVQREAGFEDESWKTLKGLARKDPRESHMSRHAAHLVRDPWQNPYQAYLDQRRHKRSELVEWHLFGGATRRTPYPNLPKPVSYALEFPSLLSAAASSPIRVVLGSSKKGPDFHKSTSVLAYRYLAVRPEGIHQQEVMQWIFEYEQKRGNHAAALRLADFMENTNDDDRNKLAEATSAQAMAAAKRIKRADRRTQLLKQTSQAYPDTPSGKVAGKQVRWELETASAQKIVVTKDFLIENPRVSGPDGLGINPILLNGDPEDGELHEGGVVFLGGRNLRFLMLSDSGDKDEEPNKIDKQLSNERLSNFASVLEETSQRNQLIDNEDVLHPDADRDHFLERARLGLADRADHRPTAQSTYVYQSMRERYGLVRGRESILPFELVLSGGLYDFNLGAFPRWRQPKKTPDSFLYR